jgi:hypothetical protein
MHTNTLARPCEGFRLQRPRLRHFSRRAAPSRAEGSARLRTAPANRRR